jgi:hypothetical protein
LKFLNEKGEEWEIFTQDCIINSFLSIKANEWWGMSSKGQEIDFSREVVEEVTIKYEETEDDRGEYQIPIYEIFVG